MEEGEEGKDIHPPVNENAVAWQERDYGFDDNTQKRDQSPQYGSFTDERDAWNNDG